MPEQITQIDETTHVDTPADLERSTHLSFDEANKVLVLTALRRNRRETDRTEYIVVMDDWALEYPPDEPITDYEVFLVGAVEDYSEKAYKLRGSHGVRFDSLMSAETEEELLQLKHLDYIDEGNGGGTTWVPKSSVLGVFSI